MATLSKLFQFHKLLNLVCKFILISMLYLHIDINLVYLKCGNSFKTIPTSQKCSAGFDIAIGSLQIKI